MARAGALVVLLLTGCVKRVAPPQLEPAPAALREAVAAGAARWLGEDPQEAWPGDPSVGQRPWLWAEPLAAAPYPYEGDYYGEVPEKQRPFFDALAEDGTRLHTTDGGDQHPEDAHYADDSVLFYAPPGFDPEAPFELVVFFHGHLATLERTVVAELAIPEQVAASGRNVLLIAPQLAREVMDSSPGKLFLPGGLAALLDEAGARFEAMGIAEASAVRTAPVVLSAFSGGYKAAIYSLVHEAEPRVRAVLLLDSIFGEVEKWRALHRERGAELALVALYSASQGATEALMAGIREDGGRVRGSLPMRIEPGDWRFIRRRSGHLELPVEGPPRWPLAVLLERLALD